MHIRINISAHTTKKYFLTICAVILISFSSQSVTAQFSNGSIEGIVIDENQVPVSNATISLRQDGIIKNSTESDSLGSFEMYYLKSGSYTMITTGFLSGNSQTVKIDSGKSTIVEIIVQKSTGHHLSAYSKCQYCNRSFRSARVYIESDGSETILWSKLHCSKSECWQKGKVHYMKSHISGRVVNEQGEAVTFPTIKIYKKKKLIDSVKGNKDGIFGTKELKHGKYKFKVIADNYKPLEMKLKTNETSRTIITLNKQVLSKLD